MSTEMWFRSPVNYIRELRECNESNVIFDYGMLVKRNIKYPKAWMDLYYAGTDYRCLVTGRQGTAEYRPYQEDPVASYATFQYGEPESLLETYCAYNIGDDEDLCNDESVELISRPVKGQEHRVVVLNFPDIRLGPGKKFLMLCKELQRDYPDVIIHIHGSTTFATLIRMGFRASDFEPRFEAAHGAIFMPTGYKVGKNQSIAPHIDWIRVLGFKPVDLKEPRNRCMFNIKSARWAADNFDKDLRIVTRNKKRIDALTPDAQYDPEVNNRVMFHNVKPKPGDKFVCNSCSMAIACKFYREGSVCSVPNSEPKELADFFKTRDVDSIMTGIQNVLQINSERAMQGIRQEEDFGLDPEVTKILASITKDAEKLAKLVDPSLRNPKIAINMGRGSTATVGLGDPRQYIGAAIREIEMQGFKREEITMAMIEGVLSNAGARPEIIEAEVIESRTDNVVSVPDLPF